MANTLDEIRNALELSSGHVQISKDQAQQVLDLVAELEQLGLRPATLQALHHDPEPADDTARIQAALDAAHETGQRQTLR